LEEKKAPILFSPNIKKTGIYMSISRRRFIKTAAGIMGATTLSSSLGGGIDVMKISKPGLPRYRRHNVMSPQGQKALSSYAVGVRAMLKLPPDDPRNWFRNAFVHYLDCPHGNWWFFVWHRGYIGYFEETIRKLSGDGNFALPYWDWTTQPRLPDSMFQGVLDPRHRLYMKTTENLHIFSERMKPAIQAYQYSLNADQQEQLRLRGYGSFDDMWNSMTGYDMEHDAFISANLAYANTCNSRFPSKAHPNLDERTVRTTSKSVVYSGLGAMQFYSNDIALSFNSSRTASHVIPPNEETKFAVIEGQPHNKVHNFIGGVGPLDPGPYGNMANNLSPTDPVFFLHHANIDRLWDVWSRKQRLLGLSDLPASEDYTTFVEDPFLFFVDKEGNYIKSSRAGDHMGMDRFNYDYEPGTGEEIIAEILRGRIQESASTAGQTSLAFDASINGNIASVMVPFNAVQRHLSAGILPVLAVEITLPHASLMGTKREWDIIAGDSPPENGISTIDPNYIGTLSVLGHRHGSTSATFVLPIPRSEALFKTRDAAGNAQLRLRLRPSNGPQIDSPIEKLTIKAVR
jgi:tyrosinase